MMSTNDWAILGQSVMIVFAIIGIAAIAYAVGRTLQ